MTWFYLIWVIHWSVSKGKCYRGQECGREDCHSHQLFNIWFLWHKVLVIQLWWWYLHLIQNDKALSEQLYKSGRIRPTLSTGQFSNLSKNQCYISRWTLWHIKFGAVTKTEALGVISSFRGWISLYRASRQNVLFFSRYAE